MRSSRGGFAAIVSVAVLLSLAAVSSASEGHGGHGACRADVEKLCPGTQPGGGAIRKCLHEHEADLSDACKQAMARRREHWQQRHGEGSTTAPSPGGEQ